MIDQTKSQLFTVQAGEILAATFPDRDADELLRFNSIIDEKYRVLEMLGKGGMGAVYRVHHLLLRKDMALKTFLTDELSDSAWERFKFEARAIARLDHPNVVKVFDFGIHKTDSAVPYYTMELLHGKSLSEALSGSIRPNILDTLRTFIQVSQGLAAVHAKGIVHGDIKPANIFLEKRSEGGPRETRVRLVDFGIASLVVERPDGTLAHNQAQSTKREIFGSPLYMSPEQFNGKKLTFASDIYSTGCALFECLTGRLPFFGSTAMATMYLHLNQSPPTLSEILSEFDVPQRLESLLAKMLAKDPADRPQSFDYVAQELANVVRTIEERRNLAEFSAGGRGARGEREVDDEASDLTDLNDLSESQRRQRLRVVLLLVASGLACALLLAVFGKQFFSAGPVAPRQSEKVSPPTTAELMKEVGEVKKEEVAQGSFDITNALEYSQKRRHFQFPDDDSFGAFSWFDEKGREFSQMAKGNQIQPLTRSFNPGQSIEDHPELLNGFKPDSLWEFKASEKQYGFDERHLPYLARMTALRSLCIYHWKLKEQSIKDLNELQSLKKLSLEDCTAPAQSLNSLTRLRELTHLNIIGLKDGGRFLEGCGPLPKLVALFANRSSITDATLKTIGASLNLENLFLNNPDSAGMEAIVGENPGSNNISDAGFSQLGRLARLKQLSLLGTKISPRSAATLAKMRHLVSLYVNKEYWSESDIAKLKALLPKKCEVITK